MPKTFSEQFCLHRLPSNFVRRSRFTRGKSAGENCLCPSGFGLPRGTYVIHGLMNEVVRFVLGYRSILQALMPKNDRELFEMCLPAVSGNLTADE